MSLRRRPQIHPQVSQISDTNQSGLQYEIAKASVGTENVTGQNLIADEKIEIGGVKWEVYVHYARSIGWFFSIGTFVLYFVYQGFSIGSNIWLSAWSTDPLASTDDGVRNKYLTVYGILGVFQAGFIMAAVSCVMVGTLLASSKLHFTMLTRILRSPMYFFDTTPLGRILNRFSKDVDIMDVTIPMNFRMLCNQLYNVIGTIFVICFANPIFISVVVPTGYVQFCSLFTLRNHAKNRETLYTCVTIQFFFFYILGHCRELPFFLCASSSYSRYYVVIILFFSNWNNSILLE